LDNFSFETVQSIQSELSLLETVLESFHFDNSRLENDLEESREALALQEELNDSDFRECDDNIINNSDQLIGILERVGWRSCRSSYRISESL
jgi:hypothetical protein